jgi:hypothetical protein
MKLSDIIGFTGVAILLIAFLLNLAKVIHQNSRWYICMNLVGAGFACAASVMIDYIPFIILEGTWALVSLIALLYSFKNNKKAP